MPRTKLDMDYLPKKLSVKIRKKLIDCDAKKSDLEKLFGITTQALNYKLRNGSFTYAELIELFRYLEFTDKEKIEIMTK